MSECISIEVRPELRGSLHSRGIYDTVTSVCKDFHRLSVDVVYHPQLALLKLAFTTICNALAGACAAYVGASVRGKHCHASRRQQIQKPDKQLCSASIEHHVRRAVLQGPVLLVNHRICILQASQGSALMSSAVQVPARPQLSASQQAVCCKCGKRSEAALVVKSSDEAGRSSRRGALLAGVSAAVSLSGTVSAGEASAAADAYEIPENQQCIECTGSGIISCTLLSRLQWYRLHTPDTR